jgi:hypothetical protein
MRTIGRVLVAVLSALVAAGAGASPGTPDATHEQTVAFARLYGVVRYFYPGDAARQIDWNRFAIAGIGDVQQAHGSADLQKTLAGLFAPLGPGIDVVADASAFPPLPTTAPGQRLVAWQYLGFPQRTSPYKGERTGRPDAQQFTGIASRLDARAFHGKTIRLRGDIRALGASTTKGLGLWLRVDRPGKPPAFFENTDTRQQHDLAWHSYDISTTVGADASQLMFGFTMTLPDARDPAAGLRGLTLEVRDDHGKWKPVAIPDLSLAQKPSQAWFPVGTTGGSGTETSWRHDGAGAGYLVLQQSGDVGANQLFDAPPVPGKSVEFALGAGLKARVTLTLTDAQARPSADRAASLAALKARLDAMPDPESAIASKAAREADVVVAWNVLRHFYPYWDVIHADWNRELPRALADADRANSRTMQKQVLRRLLVPLEDAHGTVFDTTMKGGAALPIALAPAGHRWVVAASSVPEQARVGDVVTSIDGTPMPQAAEDLEALASGQPSSLTWKALQLVHYGARGESRRFGLQHADGSTSTETFAYSEKALPAAARPQPIAELRPGIWYVDVSRTNLAMYSARTAQLAGAHAVIYDMRGYPKDFQLSKAILAHLLKHPERARWMHVPRYIGPFGELAGYSDMGWDIQPAEPHFASRAIFLADGGTISQGEAVMGYVQDDKLGTIVGSTTRGVDGNITTFTVPSGFGVVFTGMKVTHHDGSSQYHALGTPADVVVQPTVAGVRAGRDEVLDAALKLVQ